MQYMPKPSTTFAGNFSLDPDSTILQSIHHHRAPFSPAATHHDHILIGSFTFFFLREAPAIQFTNHHRAHNCSLHHHNYSRPQPNHQPASCNQSQVHHGSSSAKSSPCNSQESQQQQSINQVTHASSQAPVLINSTLASANTVLTQSSSSSSSPEFNHGSHHNITVSLSSCRRFHHHLMSFPHHHN
jgi:hypothetical protein